MPALLIALLVTSLMAALLLIAAGVKATKPTTVIDCAGFGNCQKDWRYERYSGKD